MLVQIPRLFWVGWKFHLKGLTLSNFFILISVLQPLIFATIAFYMYEAGARQGTLLYVALGAGLMGMWSSTLFGSGGAIQFQRWQGTLEIVVAAPPPFLLTMLPLTLATASIGLYSMVGDALLGASSCSTSRSSSSIRCCSRSRCRRPRSRSGCSGS